MKIVINGSYGGFGLSKEAILWLRENDPEKNLWERLPEEEDLKGIHVITGESFALCDINLLPKKYRKNDLIRTHPLLVKCVETLGSEKSSASYAQLKVIKIPNKVKWVISDYDGLETVEEKHKSWS